MRYPADRYLTQAGPKTVSDLWRCFWFGVSAPFRYDVHHFYFGRTFLSSFLSQKRLARWLPLRSLDLSLARWGGRKVFMTLQGCDARLSDESERRNQITMCRAGHCSGVLDCRATVDESRRQMMEQLLPRCDRVFVLNPELAQYVPGAVFMPYANVDVESITPVWPKTEGPITILHAPTDGGIKGTPRVLQALNKLKERWPIELLLVQNMPHADAVKLYRRADLVIDQMLAGWYGGFAVEAMALGKPVACYLREEDFNCLPPAMRQELPILPVHWDTLENDLEAILKSRACWPEWARRSRQYVSRWHHPRVIAQALVRAYRDPNSHYELAPDIETNEKDAVQGGISCAA
jgi:hypothetical protein